MTLPTNEPPVRRGPRPGPSIEAGNPPPGRETRRELAKLTATFLNGIAVAIVAVGSLTPFVTFVLEPVDMPSGLVLATISTISIVLGSVFHLLARRVLQVGFRS